MREIHRGKIWRQERRVMPSVKSISVENFAQLFGTTRPDFNDDCIKMIEGADFRYKTLGKKHRDAVILEILRRIEEKGFSIAGREGKERWERGWGENLNSFINSNYDMAELIPKYVKQNQVCRLYQEYIQPISPNFEFNVFTVLRLWLFNKFLSHVRSVFEFGCGPGYNLVLLGKLFPAKELYGLDWSEAAVETVNLLGAKFNSHISGRTFDLFNPDYSLQIPSKSAFITIGCLEQIGDSSKLFIEFARVKQPDICIHVEPVVELYDHNNLVDHLAMKFHGCRNYLTNFLPNLMDLQKSGKIEMISVKRVYFGSLFHDGWSLIIWRPKG